MILINLNDLNIYKYLDGLKKEAIETGKNEEAEIYQRKKEDVDRFIENIKNHPKPIYQDVYVAMKYHYIYGLTLRNISTRMGCGEATVSRYIKRGKELLKNDRT